jgi:hypothetical protein
MDDDARGQKVSVPQQHANDVSNASWFEVARVAIQENSAAVKPYARALFHARACYDFETRVRHSGDHTSDVARSRPDRASESDACTVGHHSHGAGYPTGARLGFGALR